MFGFIETPFFTKALGQYLSDDEYGELQGHLNRHPEAGVRKMRWGTSGRGKRGEKKKEIDDEESH